MSVPAANLSQPPPKTLTHALNLTWLSLFLLLLYAVVGFGWDGAYHATHPIDDFFTPPHIFIYVTFLLTVATFAYLAVSPDLQRWFGAVISIPLLDVEAPRAIFLAGAGIVAVGVGGVLDGIWHTLFGLDETAWSAPHAVLRWGTLLALLGFIACRLALKKHLPLSRYTPLVLALLLLMTAINVPLVPFGTINTPELLERVAALPVIATNEDTLHTYRIYQASNITRTSPLFVPLAATATGAGLAIARAFNQRTWFLLTVAFLATLLSVPREFMQARYFEIADAPASWLPLPLLPAAVVFAITLAVSKSERLAWAVAGAVFGLLVILTWESSPLLVLAAVPAMVIGAAIGNQIYRALETPTERDLKWLVAILAVFIPIFLGAVDLALRAKVA